jgi:arylsulfatase
MSIDRRDFDRRDFVKSLAASFAVPAVAALPALEGTASAAAVPKPGKQKSPNVVLMICDDLGYGDPGCYGSHLPTPNLDGMAVRGLRFTHYNSAHPICSASRAALLTGRYGLRSNTTGAFGPHSPVGTSLDETLISNLFRAKGYATKAIGKWHLGDRPEYLPTNRGFDSYYGVPYSVDMHPLPLIRDTTILVEDTDREILTPQYTEEAVKFLEGSHTKPFFLYLGFSYPHDPARASARFKDRTGFGHSGDAIAEIDWSVGEILHALERKGLTSDTLVLFTSDHGPWYQGSPGLLRGRKASTFEGGFRVPMLAQWPGTLAAGKVMDSWCSSLDILPTLSSICGLTLPEKPLDGVDISGVIRGTGKMPERKPLLYFSPMGNRGIEVHCIRKEQWKLRVAQGIEGEIYLNDRTTGAKSTAWLQRPELYDISRDMAESYDVAHLHPEIVAELMQSLEAQIPSFPPPVIEAYAKLKQNQGDISTPTGASPRPNHAPLGAGSWEPSDRRDPPTQEK